MPCNHSHLWNVDVLNWCSYIGQHCLTAWVFYFSPVCSMHIAMTSFLKWIIVYFIFKRVLLSYPACISHMNAAFIFPSVLIKSFGRSWTIYTLFLFYIFSIILNVLSHNHIVFISGMHFLFICPHPICKTLKLECSIKEPLACYTL